MNRITISWWSQHTFRDHVEFTLPRPFQKELIACHHTTWRGTTTPGIRTEPERPIAKKGGKHFGKTDRRTPHRMRPPSVGTCIEGRDTENHARMRTNKIPNQIVVALKRAVASFPVIWNTLGTFSTNAASELNILGHDGDPLSMDGAQVRIFE